MQPGQVVLFIVVTIIVIFGAYYATYYIGIKSSGLRQGRNRNINLIDRFAISKDKSFCLVEIRGKVYVVGVTNHTMTLLDTLNAEEFAKTADRREGQAYTPPGAQNIVNWLAACMTELAGKMRKRGSSPVGVRKTSTDGNADGGTFAEQLKASHDKNESAQLPAEDDKGQENTSFGPEGKK